jgi:S1-C subfamily serine protease
MGVRIDPQITDRVTIHEVVAGSPAATVGLISGDTITSIAGKLVPTFETLRSTWREVYRSARSFELTWKLNDSNDIEERFPSPAIFPKY